MHYREFFIKKKNGKTRRVCAPTKEALKLQRTLLPTLMDDFIQRTTRVGLGDVFHGFIKNKNCVTAARLHVGYKTTLCLDISNCFDSIQISNIESLPDIVSSPMLAHEDGSLAQGFATSPILACTYMIEPIQKIKEQLSSILDDYALTVYADDIHISSNETNFEMLRLVGLIVTDTLADYSLTINKRKTHIANGAYGNRRILGIQVGDEKLFANRRLRKKIRAARHQQNGPSLGGLVTASRLLLPKVLRLEEK